MGLILRTPNEVLSIIAFIILFVASSFGSVVSIIVYSSKNSTVTRAQPANQLSPFLVAYSHISCSQRLKIGCYVKTRAM